MTNEKGFKRTHYNDISENTGKINHLCRYVPPGLHRCQLCWTYDDPRQVFIDLPRRPSLIVCWTCAKPYLMLFLELFFDAERLQEPEESERSLFSYPKLLSSQKAELPSHHPKFLQAKLEQ